MSEPSASTPSVSTPGGSISAPLPLEYGRAAAPGARSNYWLGLFTLLVLVVGSYWPSMHGDFLWDDDYYVTNNKALNHPDGIERIWLGVRNPRTYPVPQYYPMTHTSFWVQTRGHDWQEPLKSWPFHLVNVLLHFMSTWMLWTILRRLNMPGAYVAAAIWALHPVQVESVAWITERKNVLSGFFLFASVLVYMRFAGLDTGTETLAVAATPASPLPTEGDIGVAATNVKANPFSLPTERGKLYALALILFVCSILSKSVTGSMPAVMLLLIWWKRGSIRKNDVLPLLPFFVLAIAMGLVTGYFEKNIVGAQGADWDVISPIQRLLIAGGAVWFYAIKLIAPFKLSFVYPRWDLHSLLLPVAFGLAAALVVWLFAARDRIGRGPIVAALIFIGSLFPALGFVNVFPMRYSFVADHFQYIASAALIAAGVWALHRFFTTPMRFTVASALILGALTAMTWSQNHVYRDLWTLWSDTLNKNPNAWIAHNNMGTLERDSGMLNEGEAHFKRVLEIRPGEPLAIMNLAIVQQKRGMLDEAIDLLKEAAKSAEDDPAHAPSYAIIYYNMGRVFEQKGDKQSALLAYRAAVDLDRRNLDATNGVGAMLLEMGDMTHAKSWFERDIEIDPLFLPAHNNLARVLLQEGDINGAQIEYAFVIQHDRNNIAAINGIGLIWTRFEKWDNAILLFKHALELDPNNDQAQKNLTAAIRHKQQAASQPATMHSTSRSTTRP